MLSVFVKMMYFQNDEGGILDLPEIEIFLAAQPWWADFYRFFLKKIILVDFTLL